MGDGTDSSHTLTSRDHDSCSLFELQELINFSSLEVEFDGIVLLDVWMGESDGSSVMSYNVWNFVWSNSDLCNFAEFEISLVGIDLVRLESSFDVIKKSEVLASLFN